MEAFVTALALAAISGITFIAYRHPHGYRRIIGDVAPLLVGLVLGSVFAAFGVTWMSAKSLLQLARTVPDSRLGERTFELGQIHDSARVGLWIVGGSLAVFLYLTFLYYLPWILGTEKRGSSSDDAA